MEFADVWRMIQGNFLGFILIMCRVSGIFSFNPIFNRSNFPVRLRVGATFVMAILFNASLGTVTYSADNLLFDILKELGLGLILGFMVNLILTVVIYAGELIDTQSGLGMAKAMDPGTGVTMPLFANVYYYMYILYFFITGGHLSYIKLFHISYETLPIGFETINGNVGFVIASYLGTVLTLAIKFAAPIIAAELIVEVCLGVLMKAVPSIHVFSVNIQLKVIVGLALTLMLAPPMSDFIERLMDIMWQNLYGLLPIIAGTT